MIALRIGDKIKVLSNNADRNPVFIGDVFTIESIGSVFIFASGFSFFVSKRGKTWELIEEAPKSAGAIHIGALNTHMPTASVVFNERIVPCDIDDTLVMHENPEQYATTVEVEDPHHIGAKILLGVNEPMVKLLRDEKCRGAFILVWSRGGYAWAATIVKALGLENHVDLIMTKPLVYLDDTEVSQWMKDRVYIKPNVTYKKHITK